MAANDLGKPFTRRSVSEGGPLRACPPKLFSRRRAATTADSILWGRAMERLSAMLHLLAEALYIWPNLVSRSPIQSASVYPPCCASWRAGLPRRSVSGFAVCSLLRSHQPSVVGTAMSCLLFVHPIFLNPCHSFPSGYSLCRARNVQGT